MTTITEMISLKGRTMETVAAYVQQYVDEHWQQVLQHHRQELEELFARLGEPAYARYGQELFRPVYDELKQASLTCDVTNPLCGPTGASAVYGPQKGATPAMVVQLDAALAHYAEIIERDLGRAVHNVPGAGAAGGLGAGLLAFLHATLRPGAQIVLEAVHLEEQVRTANLVITAEGQLDTQTAYGKTVGAVAAVAKRYRLPVLAFAGSLGDNYQTVYALGVDAVAVLPSGPMTLAYAMEHAASLMRDATERTLRILSVGASYHL